MDLVLLTETIVKMLCCDVDAVSVREYETVDEEFIHIEVLVSKEDLGRVVGKNGKIIRSVRNIVQASAFLNLNRKVKIDIDCY